LTASKFSDAGVAIVAGVLFTTISPIRNRDKLLLMRLDVSSGL
jgi:hypothetical protein